MEDGKTTACALLYNVISAGSMVCAKVIRCVLVARNLCSRGEMNMQEKQSEMQALMREEVRHIRHVPHDEYDAAVNTAKP